MTEGNIAPKEVIEENKPLTENEKEKIITILTFFIDKIRKYANVDGRRIYLTDVQIKVLLNIPDNDYIPAWKVATNISHSHTGVIHVYLTILLLKNKRLIKIEENKGKRGGMYVVLTERGKKAKQKLIDKAELVREIIGDKIIERAMKDIARIKEEMKKEYNGDNKYIATYDYEKDDYSRK